MDAMEMLQNRRSIKKYTDEPVSRDDLDQILAAGQNAPSGQNKQSYAFVVIEKPALLEKLDALNAQVMKENHPGYQGNPFYKAPCVIAVLARKDVGTHIYDGSLAMGNMLNAAHALELGACWIHRAKEVFEMPEGKELLKQWDLEGYEGIGFMIVGHADQQPVCQPRKSRVVWA